MARVHSIGRYILKEWRLLAGIVFLTALSASFTALQPWPLKLLVDFALEGRPLPPLVSEAFSAVALEPSPVALVLMAAAAGVLLFVLTAGVDALLNLSWLVSGQRMSFDLAADLFARLQRLSIRYHAGRRIGDLLSRITGDAWSVSALSSLLVAPVQQIFTFAALGYAAWMLDRRLALIVLASAPLLAASAWFFGPALKRRARHGREAEAKISSLVHQTLGAVAVVRAFGGEKRNDQQFGALADEATHLARKAAVTNTSFGIVNAAIVSSGVALVLFLGGLRVLSGDISLGTLLVFVSYVRTLQGASQGLFQIYAKFRQTEARLDRVMEILDAEDEVPERIDARPLPKARPGVGGRVSFERVSFAYEPGRPVLSDIDFETRPGEKIAIVGSTGSGKSTLVSLIPRFFDPAAGVVRMDGHDLREVRLADLRRQISFMLQEPFLLPLTVAENIAYGRPEATRAEIEAAAAAAGADEFVRRLPQGYDTPLSERGGDLSIGQRQRLAIARALVKDAPVLILDEPTSALDLQTEAALIDSLDRLARGRTTLVIAHRLSTIETADRILLLEAGRIVEQGTHAELMALGGRFRRFHDLQEVKRDAGEVRA